MLGNRAASGRRAVTALCLAVLLLGLFPATRALAQTTSGTLVGTVYDSAGNPLADARVTAVNEINGNSRSTVTDAGGTYRIPFLPPGRYTIRAVKAGFVETPLTGFPIPLNSTTNLVPPITLASATGPVNPTGPTTPTTGPTPATTTATVAGQPSEGESRASLVNTNDAARRGNFTDREIQTLPLGGTTETRTFDEYALLVAGVAPPPYTPGVRGPGIGIGVGTAGEFSVNGQRARSNNFTVDGSDNNDPDVGVRRQGFVALVPQPIESVQEFQIATLLWNSELGRNVGSQVNAVSKTGGNEVHGRLYAFFTDSKLNARNFFDYTGGDSRGENPYTRTQAGFVVGGPIVKNRTQFFASFEHIDINSATETHFAVPTAAQRSIGSPVVILSPSAGLDFFTSPSGSAPIGDRTFSLFPLPNDPGGPYGANTYSEVLPSNGDGAIASFKITHQFNENHSINARYNFTDDDRVIPAVNNAIRSTINAEARTHNLSVVFDSALGTNLFNQARFSFGRTRLQFPEYPTSPFLFSSTAQVPVNVDGQLINFESSTGELGEIVIEPFSPLGVDVFTFPQGRRNNTFQYADTMSWTVRDHAMRFGFDIRRNQLNSFQDRNYRPLVTYSNGVGIAANVDTGAVGSPFIVGGTEGAALGLSSSIRQTLTLDTPDSTIGLRFTEYDFFWTDNWRARPNFTLDYGLRYEYNTVPHEVNNRIENQFDLSRVPRPDGSLINAVFPASATSLFQQQFDAALAEYATVLDGRTEIYDNDTNNFAPHLGFAWDPWSDGKTAIRGGYGIVYDTILGAVVSQSRNVFPNEIPLTIDATTLGFNVFNLNTPSNLVVTDPRSQQFRALVPFILPGTLNQFGGGGRDFAPLLGALFRLTRVSNGAGGLAFTLPSKDLATPYTQQWHLTVEREIYGDYLVSAAYVGTKGTKLTRLTTPNLGPNSTPLIPVLFDPSFPVPVVSTQLVQSGFFSGRPNPNLGAYQIYENSANSIYHSLQLEARKRYSHGYTFTAAYTWSHAIDEVSDVFPIAGAPILPQDSFDLRAERADANFDVRHRIAVSAIWDLPWYRDSANPDATDAAYWLGGWQIASIFQGNTGQPFTLGLPFDSNLDGNLTDRPASTNGLTFVDGHGATRVVLDENAPISNFVGTLFFTQPLNGSVVPQIIPVGANGAVGRNTVRADGFVNLDVALNKTFRLGETQGLELRTEVFNLLNRANFGIPVRIIGAPGFGSSTDTQNPARVIQFALKYSF